MVVNLDVIESQLGVEKGGSVSASGNDYSVTMRFTVGWETALVTVTACIGVPAAECIVAFACIHPAVVGTINGYLIKAVDFGLIDVFEDQACWHS